MTRAPEDSTFVRRHRTEMKHCSRGSASLVLYSGTVACPNVQTELHLFLVVAFFLLFSTSCSRFLGRLLLLLAVLVLGGCLANRLLKNLEDLLIGDLLVCLVLGNV
jgi:hypothetical protein